MQHTRCDEVPTDHASGKLANRPALDEMLDRLRPGDTTVVWKLDRLGRSLRHLLATIAHLDEHGVTLRVLTEQIDTSTDWHDPKDLFVTASTKRGELGEVLRRAS